MKYNTVKTRAILFALIFTLVIGIVYYSKSEERRAVAETELAVIALDSMYSESKYSLEDLEYIENFVNRNGPYKELGEIKNRIQVSKIALEQYNMGSFITLELYKNGVYKGSREDYEAMIKDLISIGYIQLEIQKIKNSINVFKKIS